MGKIQIYSTESLQDFVILENSVRSKFLKDFKSKTI